MEGVGRDSIRQWKGCLSERKRVQSRNPDLQPARSLPLESLARGGQATLEKDSRGRLTRPEEA